MSHPSPIPHDSQKAGEDPALLFGLVEQCQGILGSPTEAIEASDFAA
jgi:hypothetical protein